MSDLEVRLEQLMTTLQSSILNENHVAGKLFRKFGEVQATMDSFNDSRADQSELGQFQTQIAALNLDEEQRSELQAALKAAANGGTTSSSASSNTDYLNELMKQLKHIQSLIRDPGADPAAVVSTIRPFYEQASTVARNVLGSFNLSGSTLLSSLQALARNQVR
ncbi:hypothetical protein [Paenibacillus caui]|uniref:hypothetical protein n=1 Tax=Paenibacillus caui TaxID=2873927 RepID=UPI001CA9689E|nr:hypothetical protein [Paenibacillus caui]